MRLTTYIDNDNYDITKEYRADLEKSKYKELSSKLSELFELDGCPIFCIVDGLNGSYIGLTADTGLCLSLDVPESECYFMDCYNLNDYMYYLATNTSSEQLTLIESELKRQRPIKEYNMPQVIISKIKPEWIKFVGPAHDYAKNVEIVKQELIKLLTKCMITMKSLKLKNINIKFGTIMYTQETQKDPERLVVLSESGYFLFENNTVYGLANPVSLDSKTESFNVVIAYAKISLLALILDFEYLADAYGEQEFLEKIVQYISTKYHRHDIEPKEENTDNDKTVSE